MSIKTPFFIRLLLIFIPNARIKSPFSYSFPVYLLVLSLAATILHAETATLRQNTHDAEIEDIEQKLGTRLFDRQPDSIQAIALLGLYEIVYDEQILYTDSQARFIIRGDIIDLEGEGNLTSHTRERLAKQQAIENLQQLAALAISDTLMFPADNEKTILTVFTEIGCPFCSRLHDERDQYRQQGVSLRYVFYSPAGNESAAYQQAQAIWCQAEPTLAFTQAMIQGKRFTTKDCEHPLDKHKRLSKQLKLAGTPVLLFADGTIWHGYYPVEKVIAEALK